jgi:hypothetical protein
MMVPGRTRTQNHVWGWFKSATAWTETLAQAGWVGTSDYGISIYETVI